MWIKKVIISVFVLILILNNSVQGAINNSIENQSSNTNSSLDSISITGNQVDLNAQLRDIEYERQFLAEREKTYDSFLNTVLFTLTIFGFLLTVVIGIAGFLFYKHINELKEDVKKDVNDFKNEIKSNINDFQADVKNELKKDLSEKAQVIIEKTMESTYEKPISDLTERIEALDDSVEDIKKALGKRQKRLPEYIREKKMAKEEPYIENIFEE